MSSASGFTTVYVKNRLGEKLRRGKGITRSQAVESAQEGVESLREEYLKAIPGEIAALETILATRGTGDVAPATIQAMLDRAGSLLVLSGTYGHHRLDAVVKRFCDLGLGMIEKGIAAAAPIAVHLRTMWLVCPGSAEIADEEAARLMSELSKIHTHYNIKCVEQAEPAA